MRRSVKFEHRVANDAAVHRRRQFKSPHSRVYGLLARQFGRSRHPKLAADRAVLCRYWQVAEFDIAKKALISLLHCVSVADK